MLIQSAVGKDGKRGWGTYPRPSMSGNSMQGRLQHEDSHGKFILLDMD